jgi:intracellular sulfur oxidation DsrE/DsrF family protein
METTDFSRRAFVIGAATIAAAAAPAAAGAADVTPTPAPAPSPLKGYDDTVPFHFDRAAFAAILNRPAEHRQVLTVRSFADARDGLSLMRNSIEAYIDPMYFAAAPNSFHAAAVFYHGSSPLLAVDDSMFAKYPLAATIIAFAGFTGTGKPGIDKAATKHPAPLFGELVAQHGASFFVCNNALSGISAYLAGQLAPAGTAATRAQVVAIHDDLAAHFLPGAFLVPAGVAAINAAQEARFTLLA